jgi:hypothetical protein
MAAKRGSLGDAMKPAGAGSGALGAFASRKAGAGSEATAPDVGGGPAAAGEAEEPGGGGDKRKGLTLRLNKAAWRQLNILALEDERHAHELLIDAVNDYFTKRRKPPLA